MPRQVQELHQDTTAFHDAFRLEELVIDVRKDHGHYITAEACCHNVVGANLCRHGGRNGEPEQIIASLIESVEKLGIHAKRYRIVREDLPPRPVLQFRDGPAASLPPDARERPRDEECNCRGQPGCRCA